MSRAVVSSSIVALTFVAAGAGAAQQRAEITIGHPVHGAVAAGDVVTRPGILGLFSSEEDLTSAVAGKFQAGGYLSHFLRTALAGEADLGPRDGTITAGELSTYLRRQFASQAANVEAETMDNQHNYQNLVIERGGVKINDVVLALASR